MYMQDYDEAFPFVLDWEANWTPAGNANIGDDGKAALPGVTGQEPQFQLVTVVKQYVKNDQIWFCPAIGRNWVFDYAVKQGWWRKGATTGDQGTTYTYNYISIAFRDWSHRTFMGGKNFTVLRESARWPMIWDLPEGFGLPNTPADAPVTAVPHFGGLNIAYGDGHAKYLHIRAVDPQWDYWFDHSGDGIYQ